MTTRYKKDFPLTVLQTIEGLLKTESQYFEATDPGESLLKFRDKDSKSDFFFEIKKYSFDNNQKLHVDVSFKPRHKDLPTIYERTIDVSKLNGFLKNWTDVLAEYDRITIFDDPILRQYEDEFLTDFELLDEDADIKSYDFKTQLLIDQYLTYCEKKLTDYKTEDNKDEIEKIEKEITELKTTQTQLPKRRVAKMIARIWAKTRKFGLGLLKDFYQEAKKEIIKQVIKGQIDLL